jgi:BirA family biotin operon repressor/biotin-[acetyl-CoA-carboxylase] ligase
MNPVDEWNLDGRRLGRRVLVFDCVDSTNTVAAALAHNPANNGIVILANQQTAGRGQHGRVWQSEPDTSVLMSVLLFPPRELRRPVVLAAWAATAVCETIRRSTGLPPAIKWPNDVLIHARKVCGILIEQAAGTVIGIGLNVNQSAESFAAAGLHEAGSLAIFCESRLDRVELARSLILALDESYDRLLQGDLESVEREWKSYVDFCGQVVTVECHDAAYIGRLDVPNWDTMLLENAKGECMALAPEAIRHITPHR